MTSLINKALEEKNNLTSKIEDELANKCELEPDVYGDKPFEEPLDFWLKKLSNYETLELTPDRVRSNHIDYLINDYTFKINEKLSRELRALAKVQKTTLYTVLLSAFYVLLAKLSGQKDVVIGTLPDNCEHTHTPEIFFANPLPLRCEINLNDSAQMFIAKIHQEVTQATTHQEFSFEKLVNALGIEENTLRHPIFQVMFSLQNFRHHHSANKNLSFIDNDLVDDRDQQRSAKYDFSLSHNDTQSEIKGQFNYAISLFDEASIQRIMQMYQRVLQNFVQDPMQSIAQIDVISVQERNTLLHTWNQTDEFYPQGKTLSQLFEQQVRQVPDNIALVFGEHQLTYGQLNEKANQLAHVIRERYQSKYNQQIQSDTLIALYLDRSVEMIISIMAVLKSGGAYVPISPEYPQARTQFALTDTKAAFIITQHQYLSKLEDWVADFSQIPSLIAADNSAVTANSPVTNLTPVNAATDLAYVIYTSGTTGQPKGVMIEHAAFISFIYGINSQLSNKTNSVLSLTQYTFDIFGMEYAAPFLTGGCIVLSDIGAAHRDLAKHSANINIIQQTPSTWEVFFHGQISNLSLSHIQILVGGESGSSNLFKKLAQTFSSVHQVYGPTETSIWSTCSLYHEGSEKIIGKPLKNESVYVLSDEMAPVPMGAKGELYIAGMGLARGYLNRPELTAERFIDNPFMAEVDQNKGNNRLYKTGDLVRWLADGSLEYLGRNDSQVKIRGFRIELGEIESALLQLNKIKQAVVILREKEGDKCLSLYYVSDEAVNIEDLREHLSQQLPDYMLPRNYTKIDSVPLTINGKLDKQALPEPEFISSNDYIAPKNELEELLCVIWQSVLGVDRVGVQDNFFGIGGDSIVSIQLVSKLRQAGFDLQVYAIFDAPTVAQLAHLLSESAIAKKNNIEQGALSGSFDLLPIQQCFFDKSLLNPGYLNQAFMLKIPGDILPVDIELALKSLAQRHDVLRCNFDLSEHGYRQHYHENTTPWMTPLQSLEVSELNELLLHQQLTAWQSCFNLTNGPLWQAGHLTGYADYSARLFFACHHLLIDDISQNIISKDMELLLNKQPLTTKSSSYRQWSDAVKKYAKSYADETSYWRSVIADQITLPDTDYINDYTICLSKVQTMILLREANDGYHTEVNDLLLSALALAMNEVFDRPVNHITLKGHGREMVDDRLDISQTVGCFTTLYPVKLINAEGLSDTIINTKEMLRAIPNEGIGYGALIQAGALTSVLPKICFNYLGQVDNDSTQTGSEMWQIIEEDCGQMVAVENTDELHLNINGVVQNGVLQFNIASCLSSEKGQCFADTFEEALIAVARQGKSAAQMGGVKTPSDYGVESLSIEALRDLEDLFENKQPEKTEIKNNNNVIEV